MLERMEAYYRDKYEQERAAAIGNDSKPGPSEAERAHLHTTTVGAWLPVLQAVITGVFIGLAVLAVAVLARWSKPGYWFMGGWLMVQAVTWLGLLWRWLGLTRPVITVLEDWARQDINQDGVIGSQIPFVRIELAKELPAGTHQTSVAMIPCSQDKLAVLARGLMGGIPLSEREWTGSGKPFSLNEFRAVRKEMVARGLVVQSNDKTALRGFSLSRGGAACMRYFASLSAAPAPSPAVIDEE